jgi:5-methylthioribose kinase
MIRHEKIKDILNTFPYKPTTVNNIKIMTFDEIIDTLYKRIYAYVENKHTYAFRVIHGDMNFGNIMYNSSTNDVMFIDPKGFFGDQQFMGPDAYDFAKIAFSLSGYDEFYKDPKFNFTLSNDKDTGININVNIYKKDIYDTVYEDIRSKDELIHILMISIWLGAPQYLEFNIPKLIASHYYSLYLATQCFQSS